MSMNAPTTARTSPPAVAVKERRAGDPLVSLLDPDPDPELLELLLPEPEAPAARTLAGSTEASDVGWVPKSPEPTIT